MTLGVLFVNLVVPAGIAGGTALFAQDFARRGKPATRTATGVLLQLIADFSAFAFILVPGLIHLFTAHDLKTYEVLAAVILLLMTPSLGIILLSGVWKPARLRQIFEFFQRIANGLSVILRRPPFLANDSGSKEC